VHWRADLLTVVERLRRQNPSWGRWPIRRALVKEGYRLSERTVGRILEGHRCIERAASFLARQRGMKWGRKHLRRYARRKPPGYEAKRPGELVQVETLTVRLGRGQALFGHRPFDPLHPGEGTRGDGRVASLSLRRPASACNAPFGMSSTPGLCLRG
jgi:hypothetical protein